MNELDKLQHIYDRHAGDFGLSGNKKPEQVQRLRDAIDSHLIDTDTRVVAGQYRGREASLYYNLRTEIAVVVDGGNNVVAGFKASSAQAAYILARGRLN